jgi:hypothetical protein
VWTTWYEFTAQSIDNAALERHWPVNTSFELAEDRPTLLLFMHPRCPCTRASVRELERTLTGAGLSEAQQPKCIVVASLPPNASAKWRETDTVRRASGLPGAEIAWDVGGIETSRFGVATSGAVMLFHPNGELLFAGGVTASRGHDGDNAGSRRLHALLSLRSQAFQESTPVFGCRLCVESGSFVCGETCQARQPNAGPAVEGAVQ